jgi:putative addiction module CopG family antidote
MPACDMLESVIKEERAHDLKGLPADLEHFIHQELARGKYPSEADLVTEAVRLLRERERRLEELRKELQPALEALDRGDIRNTMRILFGT